MDAWLQEFSNWRTEEEEFQEFAQPLCKEFRHWQTAEEEFESYAESFLAQQFPHLPIGVVKAVRVMVWEYHKKKKYLPFGMVNGSSVTFYSSAAWEYYISQNRFCSRQ